LIALRGVTREYRSLLGRTVRAVDDISLEVAAGEVLGIAGPNGAGKTTMLAMLMGFLRPTSGTLRIDGVEPRAFVEQHGVAYVPELMALPTYWTVDGALRRLATLADLPPTEIEAAVDRVVEALAIGDHRRKRLKALSKGNFQRVGIAQALLRDDMRLVVFDEPTHGLDPVWTARFREIVHGMRRPDRVIVVASHNLDELERVCDRVAIVDHGRIQRVVAVGGAIGVASGAVAYRIRAATGVDAVVAAFPGATASGTGEVDVAPVDLPTLNAGLAAAIAGGALISSVAPRESALETAFRSAVGGER
jgi:ABC-2 type transport system ATP-binding protein